MRHKAMCLITVDGNDCANPAEETIVFVDRTGMRAVVPVCNEHKAEHNNKAADLRTRKRKG